MIGIYYQNSKIVKSNVTLVSLLLFRISSDEIWKQHSERS